MKILGADLFVLLRLICLWDPIILSNNLDKNPIVG